MVRFCTAQPTRPSQHAQKETGFRHDPEAFQVQKITDAAPPRLFNRVRATSGTRSCSARPAGTPGENGTVESGPKRPASPIQPPHLSGRCSEPSRGCYAEFPESFRRRSCRRGSSKGALYGARTLVSQAVRPQAELSDRAKRGGMTDRNTGTSPAAQPADAGRALPIPLWGRKEPAPTRAVSGSRGLGSFNLARRFLAATADVPSGGSGSSPPAAPPPGHVPQRHYGRYSPASK